MTQSISKIPEKIAKNQFLFLASLTLILIVFSLTQNVNAVYVNLEISAFIYFYLAFILNTFFVKVVYRGTTRNVDRLLEFIILFILTIFWLVASFVIYFSDKGYLGIAKIDIVIFTFIVNALALITAVIAYVTSLAKERSFNNKLKRLLLNELFSNLLVINDNLSLIEQFKKEGKATLTFGYISNNIFHSLVNTNKITMLGIDIIPNLISFYNDDQTTRKIMAESITFEQIIARRDQDRSCLVKNKFIEMKKLLEQLFKDFGREKDYKEWQAKGIKDWDEHQEKIKDSSKVSRPQIY
ncbi:hypothetical protein AMJ47_00580 [Parcubacteria bacterium DG_72]|nr:MAG: hypothetical protein AMJ47_00580 [Parcubacteria bacterium DG_72]